MPGEKGNSIGAQGMHHTLEPDLSEAGIPKLLAHPFLPRALLELCIFKGMVNDSIMTSTAVPSLLPAHEVGESTDFGPGSFKRKISYLEQVLRRLHLSSW